MSMENSYPQALGTSDRRVSKAAAARSRSVTGKACSRW